MLSYWVRISRSAAVSSGLQTSTSTCTAGLGALTSRSRSSYEGTRTVTLRHTDPPHPHSTHPGPPNLLMQLLEKTDFVHQQLNLALQLQAGQRGIVHVLRGKARLSCGTAQRGQDPPWTPLVWCRMGSTEHRWGRHRSELLGQGLCVGQGHHWCALRWGGGGGHVVMGTVQGGGTDTPPPQPPHLAEQHQALLRILSFLRLILQPGKNGDEKEVGDRVQTPSSCLLLPGVPLPCCSPPTSHCRHTGMEEEEEKPPKPDPLPPRSPQGPGLASAPGRGSPGVSLSLHKQGRISPSRRTPTSWGTPPPPGPPSPHPWAAGP